MEQLKSEILEIYELDQLLDTLLPLDDREHHQQLLEERLTRVSKLLPAGISPMPNEIFTAVEFLIYQYESRPVHLGQAITRLELLAEEMRARPMIYSLVTGRAN